MKKFLKVVLALGAIIGGIAGVLYFLERKNDEEDFDDFEDVDFEDVFEDEEDDRDYVTLDFEDETEE